MILFYSRTITERLKYAVGFVLNNVIGVNYDFTTNKEEFLSSSLPCINYSNEKLDKGIFIQSYSLLFKSIVEEENPPVLNWNSMPILYPQKGTDFPFDIFAATFYLISRYEEYLPYRPDSHGRFPASESIAFKNNFLQRPIIEEWSRQLMLLLTIKYPMLKVNTLKYKYTPSIDIDAFAVYRHQTLQKTLLGIAKDFVTLKPRKIATRFSSLASIENDPWNTFDYLLDKYRNDNQKFLFFIHAGNTKTKYDQPSPLFLNEIKSIIYKIMQFGEIGLHPSYYASSNKQMMSHEYRSLQYISASHIINSRQHYLKFNLPDTYRTLYQMGIKNEYSMGYPDDIGFRAGTSHPFYFYDLDKEQITMLKVFPFAYMDTTLNIHLKLSPEEAKSRIAQITDVLKKYSGRHISLWHNGSLSNYAEWKGWRDVFEFELKETSSA